MRSRLDEVEDKGGLFKRTGMRESLINLSIFMFIVVVWILELHLPTIV